MNKKLLVAGIVILLVAAVYLIDRGTRGAQAMYHITR